MTWTLLLLFAKRYWHWFAVGLAALALLAWAGAGHSKAKKLAVQLRDTQTLLVTRTDERDKAREERAAALDAAEQCSASVARLKDAADAQRKQADAEIRKARTASQQAQARAQRHLRSSPAVPGNDAASARVRIDEWLKER